MANPAAVPLSLLVIVVLDLLSLPVYNLVSRQMEAEADWKALETTHDPASAEALFKQFAIPSLNDPDPPTWSYLVFDSHPPSRRGSRWPRRAETPLLIVRAQALGLTPSRKRVLRAAAAFRRRQPAALGGDRAALDAVRGSRHVHRPGCRRPLRPRRPVRDTSMPMRRPGRVDVGWTRMWFGWSSRVLFPERKTDDSLSKDELSVGRRVAAPGRSGSAPLRVQLGGELLRRQCPWSRSSRWRARRP